MSTIPRCSLSALLWLLLGAAPLGAQEVRISYSSARHGDEGNPDYGNRSGWIVTRIVDARTGTPIPGAELLRIEERTAPTPCELWWSQREVADENGFVRMHVDQRSRGSWFMVRAPGYGAQFESGSPRTPVVELGPAESLPVLLRDHLDRPVAGARVGICLGCGHSPDVACGTTDERGYVELSGADPYNGIFDLYVTHQALAIAYDNQAGERLGVEPPYVLRVDRGASIRGVLRDGNGAALAHARVGFDGPHRGPWTSTEADGTFSLSGGMWQYGRGGIRRLLVSHGAQFVSFAFEFHRMPELRLPPPNGGTRQEVDLAATDPIGLAPFLMRIEPEAAASNAIVRIVGPAPHGLESRHSAQPSIEHALPPGRYDVELHSVGFAVERRALEVVAGERAELVLEARPLAAVRVHLHQRLEEERVKLVTEHASFDVTTRVRDDQPIGLPEGEFRFFVGSEHEPAPRCIVVDRERALAEGRIELEGYRPTLVHGRIVEKEEGSPFEGTVALLPRGALPACADFDFSLEEFLSSSINSWFALPFLGEGVAFLVVQRKGEARFARVMPVLLPAMGVDQQLDLGDVVLPERPPLSVELPDDVALEGQSLTWQRSGWMATDDEWGFPLDHRGRWFGPDLAAGDVLRWIAPEPEPKEDEAASRAAVPSVLDVEVRWVLEGSGPWNLRVPKGEVLLDLRTEDGATQRFSILVGTEDFFAEPGSVVLRYLAPGPQRLFISAEGHQTAIVDVEVSEERRVEAKVVLPRRT